MENQNFESQYEQLIKQAEHLPTGSLEKVGLLEKAINLADLMKDKEKQKNSRSDYVQAATFAGLAEKAMTAYSVLLKFSDENSEDGSFFKSFTLLWQYKWIVGHLTRFPRISKEKILLALEDMKRRYQKANYGLKPIYHYYYTIHGEMGDFDTANEYFEKAEAEKRTMMSDCETCTLSAKINFLIQQEKYEEAIEASQPILLGEKSCSTIPNEFYHKILIPMMLN